MFDLKSEIGIFKLVIDNDKADLASRSASSLPRMLVWLGSQQKTISLKAER